MDKYEYTIKSDKIKKLVERKDYDTAAKIADTIDWDRIKNVKMLSTVSQAYEKVGRFEDAKDILLIAYECAPVGRRFLYRLTELAVKQGQYDEAETYLKEFAATSPQDPSRLILRYEIAQAKGDPVERLITILEAYQKREFEEKWSYELASLYYKAGKEEECVKLCDEIVLWFGVGAYVDKAMELKQRIAPLTPDQLEKRENKEKYLRRLEDVQREFENSGKQPEERAEKPEEDRKEMPEEQEQLEERLKQQVKLAHEEQAASAEPEAAEEEAIRFRQLEDAAAVEAERLQAEMEATLAREIETAAMSATIDEAMLRETAVSMEAVGAVENDHSQENERTKVADGHFVEQTRTREFILQARAINEAIKEAQGRPVTAAAVEEKMSAAQESMMSEPAVQEEAKIQAEAEETQLQKAPAAEPEQEEPQAEIPAEEPAAEPEREEPQPEIPAEEPAAEPEREEPQAEIPAEEPAAEPEREEPQPEIPAEEPAAEPEREEPQPEMPAEEPGKESAHRMVRDHYVLIASDSEERGLRECVAYIRRMRELLGCPTSQVAKISGAKLAVKDMGKTLKKLQGRDLIVTGIADLPDSVLADTIDVMAKDKTESFIALIDTGAEIEKLQERMAFFADCRVISCEAEQAKDKAVPEAEHESAKPDVEEPKAGKNVMPETKAAGEEAPAEEVPAEEVPAEGEHQTLAQLVEAALRAGGLNSLKTEQKSSEPEQPEEEQSESEEGESEESEPGRSEAEQPRLEQEADAEERPKTVSSAADMNANDFFEFAVQYAHMLDAVVDDMGGLAVFAVAEQYQQDRVPLTEELAQELVEKAILRAERRSLKSLFSNRYDKEGYLILKEEHFKE